MDLLMDLQIEKKLEGRSCTLREALETHADERNKASQSDAKKLETQLYQLASMVAPMYHRASLMDSQTEKKVGKARPCMAESLRDSADERNKASQRDEKKLETQLYQLESVVAPASIGQERPYRLTDRDKSWKGEAVHYEKPQRLTQMSATRHPDQMKKSWKRNFINLKKAAA